MKEELALRQELKDVLTELLVEEQGNCTGNSVAARRPSDWLKAASVALSGGSLREMRRQADLDHYTCKRIHGLVMTSEEAKHLKKERAVQLSSHLAELSELEGRVTENMLSDEYADRLKEFGTKELQNLALASKLTMEQLDRVTGQNVQKIEVNHTYSAEDYDEAREALKKRIAESKKAEVIDV